jgi:hypothetical protein
LASISIHCLQYRPQCMTVPVGLATYVFLPDTPHTTRAWFLSQDERDMAAARVVKAGKAAPAKTTARTLKKVLSCWRWYAFVLGYVVSGRRASSRFEAFAHDATSCSDPHAAATGISPSGSSPRVILSSIGIFFLRAHRSSRLRVLFSGVSCRITLEVGICGYWSRW